MHAVVKLQANVRCKHARKQYGEMLYAKYLAEEEAELEAERRRVEETFKMLDALETARKEEDEHILETARYRYEELNSEAAPVGDGLIEM